jgi:ferrous iron transport protein A
MNLADLKENQRAVITNCKEKELPLKLMEMGCVEGVEISFVNKAPFGTPYYFIIGSTRIALGKEIVKGIEVKLIDENETAEKI